MVLVKIGTLKLTQLKKILRTHNLPTSGPKATLVTRILESLDRDEFEENDLVSEEGSSSDEISDLREEIKTLGELVREVAGTVKSLTRSKATCQTESEINIGTPPSVNTCPASPSHIVSSLNRNSPPPLTTNNVTPSPFGNVTVQDIDTVPPSATNIIPPPPHANITVSSAVISTPPTTTTSVTSLFTNQMSAGQGAFAHLYLPSGNAMSNTHQSATALSSAPFSRFSHDMSIREMSDILPEFDPNNELSLSPERFVARVNGLISLHQWTEQNVLTAIQTKLKGPARIWADSALEVCQSWREFSSRLCQDFGASENEADIHMKLMNCTRRSGERITEYFYRARAMGNKYQISDAAIIRYIRNGLKHSELQNSLASMEFKSTNELRCAVERYLTNRATVSTGVERRQPARPPLKGEQRFTPQTPNAPPTGKKPPGASIICYNCFEAGHLSMNCSKPQRRSRCTICLRTNHTDATCPESKGKRQDMVHKIFSAPKHSENRLKNIKINGQAVQAFIDTGSDRSLIRHSVAGKISCIKETGPFTLKGFAGGEYNGNSSIFAHIETDDRKSESKLLVVEDLMLSHDVLLGNDYLNDEQYELVLGPTTCRFEAKNKSNIRIGSQLSQHEVDELLNVVSEYSDCFGETLERLGSCKTTSMNIKLTSDQPVSRKPYRVPFAKRKVIDGIIDDLMRHGIIRPSSSPYSSPIVLVKKANGEDRMCVDYRALNAITVKMPFPMPTVEEILSTIAGHKHFTTLDLMSGYYQIPVDEDSKQYTAFITHRGQYEFNRMPFGLVNAPGVFQTMITRLIQNTTDRIISYVDEVIIPSRSVTVGLQGLVEFLELVRDAGLTLRPSKCTFLATEIAFLGHQVTTDGIKPGKEKTIAIQNLAQPTTVTEVRRFLGLTGFFRKFVPNYSSIVKPLTNLLKTKNAPPTFKWTEDQTSAFVRIKDILCKEPVLEVYDANKDHQVHTDASSHGLAGILLQKTKNDEYKPVFYYSRCCTAAESNYTSHELEVLAVVETVERFRMYLLGKHFHVFTDCAAVSSTKATTPMVPRIARWWLKLSEYDFTVVHRPGSSMSHVDAMSRAPVLPPTIPTTVAAHVLRVIIEQEDWVSAMQLQDPRIASIIAVLKEETNSDQITQLKTEYDLKKGRLYRLIAESRKLVVPTAIRWRIVKWCHDDHGHFGLEKTLERIQRDFWFRRMRNYVKSYIAACLECCFNKKPAGAPEGRMFKADITPIPFRTLQIDHLGPFPRSRRGNMYVIGIADTFSKYVIVKAVKTTKTQPVLITLNELTTYFGLPATIITDRGTAYTSRDFEAWCHENGIRHIKVAVRTPRANGQIERVNQTILQFLRTADTDTKDWDTQLRLLQWTLNTQRNATTGYSPHEIIFDFSLKDISINRLTEALHQDDEEEGSPVEMRERRNEAAARISKERDKWKARFDARHKSPTVYTTGDLVVVEAVPSPTGESHKLDPKYRGPFIISKVLRNDRYLVKDIDSTARKRHFTSVFTPERIKPWCQLSPDLDGISDTDEEEDDVLPLKSGLAELSAERTPLSAERTPLSAERTPRLKGATGN